MNRFLFITLALLVLAVGMYIFLPHSGEIRNYPSNGNDIIAFGDSLVEGVGATSGHDLVSLLSVKVGRPIINLGKSGDTTNDALARINSLDFYNPKVVLVLVGGNDYLKRIPRETTEKNLGKIIEHIQSRGAIVLLLGVRGGIFRDHFADMYEDVSDTYRTAFVSDILEGIIGNSGYMADPIHPNDAGYTKIANRIAPVLASLLK